MSIEQITCTVVKCDGCGDGYQHEDEGGTPHFTDAEDAAVLFRDRDEGQGYGWTKQDQITLCRTCSVERLCFIEGHVWSEWRDCLCGGRNRDDLLGMRVRSCDRCNTGHEREPNGEPACATPPEPFRQSRGALMVTQWRNGMKLRAERPDQQMPDFEDHYPEALHDLLRRAAELVALIDASLETSDV